ncbi:Type-2 restriction enzyme Sau3AI [Jeotgalicoccus saudimassiliensis]|uniref:Type-2 restriction enzyme Sau3AI n=1 Tax=Jeotgalicoccus saudimassiliensis TaxID=1461582 RepID=A0A078M9I4_9STAP|nr:MutH/Sau3AI family endonuclease [Jeotgalicoccus saudimassiliensis]CEA02955.1 Type-2 restriction enzyme Sau3AI [Jeotgalicoccus saudimassiliensis]
MDFLYTLFSLNILIGFCKIVTIIYIIENASDQIVAKERISLGMINYNSEVTKDFYESSFWKKNNKLLIFFYTYVLGANNKPDDANFRIERTVLHESSEKDLEIIKKDWDVIRNKIKMGQADELSERDTNILGAATKGAPGATRSQPFSDIPAKTRAYSLKKGYVTSLVR